MDSPSPLLLLLVKLLLLLPQLAQTQTPTTTDTMAATAPATASTTTSTATVPPPEEDSSVEFDSLMEQIETRQSQPNIASAGGLKVSADPNNRTTMRFFRNNKTFASIVYTNENAQQQQHHHHQNFNNNSSNNFNSYNQYKSKSNNNIREPRRLINCHLLDLERHSSDVGVFENKYDIKTNDIEFKEMMQLIKQCTNIARFKPLKSHHFNNQLNPNVAQLFGVPTGAQRNSFAATGTSGHKHPAGPGSMGTGLGSFRPFLVVGRPVPSKLHPGPGSSPAHFSYAHGPSLQQLKTSYPASSQNSVSTFHTVMSGALNQELQKLPPVVDDSNKLDLPKIRKRQLQRRTYNIINNISNNNNTGNSLRPAQAVAKSILQRARETGKKLVLGEVTPPPSAVDSRQGGIKEAIQEITSYDTTDLLAIWRGILPGTNWCGMGDRATSYNDLGFESDIDICCRAHDFCPIRLSAFSGGYGLFNWSFYTRSHCWCDQNFLDCLQRAQSPLSAVVMKFYFTIMKTTCLHDNETASAYVTPPNSPINQFGPFGIDDGNNNNNHFQQQFPLQGAARQHSAPQNFAPQQVQSTNPFNNNNNNINENIQNKQPTLLVQQNNAAQQRLLLDQIKATMPIAALKHSQVVQSRIETHQNSNSMHQQHQPLQLQPQ